MQLTLWTYEGPPHVGAMRVATAMRDVHYVLHAPQGDTYADLLFTMIERDAKRPPVTYTTFQARDLGGDTAELFKTAAREAFDEALAAARGSGTSVRCSPSSSGATAATPSTAVARATGYTVPKPPDWANVVHLNSWLPRRALIVSAMRSQVMRGRRSANSSPG